MFTGVFYKPHNSESDVAQIPRTNTTHGAVGTITHTHTHTLHRWCGGYDWS